MQQRPGHSPVRGAAPSSRERGRKGPPQSGERGQGHQGGGQHHGRGRQQERGAQRPFLCEEAAEQRAAALPVPPRRARARRRCPRGCRGTQGPRGSRGQEGVRGAQQVGALPADPSVAPGAHPGDPEGPARQGPAPAGARRSGGMRPGPRFRSARVTGGRSPHRLPGPAEPHRGRLGTAGRGRRAAPVRTRGSATAGRRRYGMGRDAGRTGRRRSVAVPALTWGRDGGRGDSAGR